MINDVYSINMHLILYDTYERPLAKIGDNIWKKGIEQNIRFSTSK